MKALVVTIGILLLGFAGQLYADGILFVGTELPEINVANPQLPDQLGKFTTSGATITGGVVIDTDFFFNGVTVVGDILVTGHPNFNTINTVDFDGNLLETFAGDIPGGTCCNEDYAYDGTSVWQAKIFGGGITELDPNNLGGQSLSFSPIEDVIGMTFAEGQIWISRAKPDWHMGSGYQRI